MKLHQQPYYTFIGWAGFVTLAVLLGQTFFEYAAAVGWCLIAGSILAFYLFTIEAPSVKCEWAGWILSPALVLVVFSGVEPMTQILWVLSLLALGYTALMYRAERDSRLYQRLPRYLRPLSPKPIENPPVSSAAEPLAAEQEAA
jgi:hypothetical protein